MTGPSPLAQDGASRLAPGGTMRRPGRVVVAVTGAPSGVVVIRRAARIADRSGAQLVGVHVHRSAGEESSAAVLDEHRRILQALGATLHDVHAEDVVAGLVGFARQQGADQLVLGSTGRSRLAELLHGSVLNEVLRAATDMDVHVVGQTGAVLGDARSGRAPLSLPPLSPRRRQLGWLLATAGTGATTVALAGLRGTFGEGSEFLLLQAVVVAAAAVGGAGPAVGAAVLAAMSLNWYFLPPLHTWEIDDHENVLALVIFVLVGVLVGLLVTALASRTAAARRGQSRAEALARAAVGMAVADDPVDVLLRQLRDTLGVDGVSLLVDGAEVPLAVVGEVEGRPERSVDLPAGARLRLVGETSRDDEQVIEAFAAQLSALLERRRLREDAARAQALAAADELRTAILRAVSHDLRTPLASIKASVTSLRQRDVAWDQEAEQEFLATIDEEADRLDAVIADLLDASRLEAGAIQPAVDLVALDEVVAAAVRSVSGLTSTITIDVSPSLPLVRADGGLLTRAVANVVANADGATPTGGSVVVTAEDVGDRVELRVIDRGPGIPADQRAHVFAPFQRGGDQRSGGVGLGLSVAQGVVTAMGGALRIEDTPGGGLTMVIALPVGDEERRT